MSRCGTVVEEGQRGRQRPTRARKFLAAWVCAVMVGAIFIGLDLTWSRIVEGNVVVHDGKTYVTHTPIRINSNAEFATMAVSEGWNGSGTVGDPWIIENLNINGLGSGNCVYIGNVTNYYIIQYCYFHNASGNSGAYHYNSGIVIYYSHNGILKNNTISSCTNRGIYITYSSDFFIYGNKIQLNSYGGLYLSHDTSISIDTNLIVNNDIVWFDSSGIKLDISSFISITNNNITRSYSGIHIYYSSSNKIINNSISNIYYGANQIGGIYCVGSQANIIKLNNIKNINTGIWLRDGSDYNFVYFNYIKIEHFQKIGICVDFSSYDTFWGNTLIAGGISLCDDLPYWGSVSLFNTHIITINNTVNGKPIYYMKNIVGGKIPSDGGQVILANSRNMVIENLTIIDAVFLPIQLYFSDYNIIQNNTVNWVNVVLDGCGISLYSSDNNQIVNNTILDYSNCIWISSSSYNMVFRNQLATDQCCIQMGYDSTSNEFCYNTFAGSNCAVIIFGSDNNLFFHNYFINNTDGYYIQFDAYGNMFHNGYPIGGNFWSNYVGVDSNHGINQDIPGEDGIGDTPLGLDRYPLMPSNTQLPFIDLISPANNSLINPNTVVDLSIWERSLEDLDVDYSLNGAPAQSLSYPYDISVVSWPDGDNTIYVSAFDEKGKSAFRFFNFSKDSFIPTIILNSPMNNSVILPGTIIDFDIFDNNLKSVRYWKNGVVFNNFNPPYNISTSSWTDNIYQIMVYANDTHGNEIIRQFYFTIDSLAPTVNVNSPSNNSVITSGTILDIFVFDQNLQSVNYSINNGVANNMLPPYDVDTSGWLDGVYLIKIQAMDVVGHSTTTFLQVFLDSSPPTITLNSPSNNSMIRDGRPIDLSVNDEHLNVVTCSINGGPTFNLFPPYDINTITWGDGNYSITVDAVDVVNNGITKVFSFTVNAEPTISLIAPNNNAIISPGCILDFIIIDEQLINASFSVNGNSFQVFVEPYDINTTNWTDGLYSITIRARDGFGEVMKIYYFTIDSLKADSNINPIINYWRSHSPTILDATANDINGVANVTLWYRFSADNTTWGSWTAFGIVEVSPWQWNFAFPHGDGYYEFYSISNDTAGNMELTPGSADARCAYDATAPGADAGSDMAAVEGSIVVFNASASTDNIGITNYTWVFNYSGSTITLYGVCPSFNFTLAGNYTVTLTVRDAAWNSDSDTMTVLVTSTPPPDSDGDGVPDDEDVFPDNPDEWEDTDGDGVGDKSDAFPDDPDEWADTDGDGAGDTADAFPDDPTEWADTDGDGIGDNSDTNEPDNPAPDDAVWVKYWWIIVLVVASIVLMLFFISRKSNVKPASAAPKPVECPGCGFTIEAGKECPFCADDKAKGTATTPPQTKAPIAKPLQRAAPMQSRPQVVPAKPSAAPATQKAPSAQAVPKSTLSDAEMISRIEKAYKEGKMSKAQYDKNMARFRQ